MALYPGAVQRNLGKGGSALSPDVLCLHTMVGSLKGTDSYFRTVSVFSHFGIGGAWGGDVAAGLDGVVYQWGDTSRRAAANLDGNDHILSVETADNAVRPIQPWTTKQQTAIVNLLVWAHKTHGIPLVLVPDSKPGRRGIAYHRLGCDPYRVDGGELWSSSYGKDCPTQARINQIPSLIARAIVVAQGGTDDMPLDSADKAAIKSIVDTSNAWYNIRAVGAALSGSGNQAYPNGAEDTAGWNMRAQLAPLISELAASKAREAGLLAAITAISPSVSGTPIDYERLQAIVDSAANKAVDSLDLDVVRVT